MVVVIVVVIVDLLRYDNVVIGGVRVPQLVPNFPACFARISENGWDGQPVIFYTFFAALPLPPRCHCEFPPAKLIFFVSVSLFGSA